jgi:hypothetical protein
VVWWHRACQVSIESAHSAGTLRAASPPPPSPPVPPPPPPTPQLQYASALRVSRPHEELGAMPTRRESCASTERKMSQEQSGRLVAS